MVAARSLVRHERPVQPGSLAMVSLPFVNISAETRKVVAVSPLHWR